MPAQAPKTKKTALDRNAPVAREYTIHLHKHLKGEYVTMQTNDMGPSTKIPFERNAFFEP